MKYKTSVTLSEDVLENLERLEKTFNNRSEVIETALRFYIEEKLKKAREEKDRKILNRKAARLNKEAEEVLGYQINL